MCHTQSIAHDIFLLQKFGNANKEILLRQISEEDRKWMERELLRERRRRKALWYNVTMCVLGKLGFKEEETRLVRERTATIDKQKFTLQELEKEYKIHAQAVEAHIRDKTYKLLTIANPANGAGFFQILFSLDWNSKSHAVTEDKLLTLSASTIGPTRRQAHPHGSPHVARLVAHHQR